MNSIKCLLILFFIITGATIKAQTNPHRCLTHEKISEAIAANPSIADSITWDDLNTGSPEDIQQIITIPVVVHIVYRTNAQNISQNQVQSQISALNRDFRKLNSDTNLIPAPFKALAADSEIEFCLANMDPDGNPTNGIVRKQTSISNIGATESYYTNPEGSPAWPRASYLNIWVCEIDSYTIGFAYPPGGAGPDKDGVVIDYRSFGTIGTAQAPFNLGRTATHEIGHFFNLFHIWGFTNCGNDFVSDTPVQTDANYGCPTFPHRINSCSSTNPNGDMFMNYMDYVNDACMNMFSNGQKTRMINALNSGTSQRSSLKTSQGCSFTGISKKERPQESLEVYPNPSSGMITIKLPELNSDASLTIHSMDGKIIYTHNPATENFDLDITGFPSGMYFVKYGLHGVQKLILH